MHATELWESRALGPTVARILLLPLAGLYAVGWEAYRWVYKLGLKRAKRPHTPTICVGNLVSGGSGKTPVTLFMVETLRSMGYPVVVSSSGYGGPRAEAASLAPAGELLAAEWGDEAAMFRMLLPDLPLIVGRRRVLAAELCHQHFPKAVLILDDGFQHLPLAKDISIVLDPPNPKNRWCLPAGPYREPRWNRNRADLVLPGQFDVVSQSGGFIRPDGERADPPKSAALICALGQPLSVIRSVEAMGVDLTERRTLPDHDPLTRGTLMQGLPVGIPIVVTAKDWVKIRARQDLEGHEFLILEHRVEIHPAEAFRGWLQAKIDGIQEANLSR